MRLVVITAVIILALTAVAVGFSRSAEPKQATAAAAPILLPLSKDAPPLRGVLVEPVVRFVERATLKRFGIYITPDTSPVAGDRFSGFHTGIDAEFTDATGDVSVRAVADGTVISQSWVSGYGGVVVIRHVIGGIPTFAIYGHLDEASFVRGTTRVRAGDVIGMLGDDHSQETDGVRKHLHFALYRGEKVDYRGYVPVEAELADWVDPLTYF